MSKTASQQEIKLAYKTYASKFHPDKHAGDKFFEEKFKELQEAYSILSDPQKRQAYDCETSPRVIVPQAQPAINKSPQPSKSEFVKTSPVKTKKGGFSFNIITFGIAGGLLLGGTAEMLDWGDGFGIGFIYGFLVGGGIGQIKADSFTD